MTFAVIQTGGKQYKVKASDILKIEKLKDTKDKIEFNEVLADKLFQFLTPKEARIWRQSIQDELSPYPVHVQQQQTNEQLAKEAIENQKAGDILNKTGAPRLSEFIEAYSRNQKWSKMRNKTKSDTFSLIPGCINIIGDLPVDQVHRQNVSHIA